MSLFICNNCGCVENSALIHSGLDATRADMLCSECESGSWHGEFDKRAAKPIELLVSKFSPLGYITPYDHVVKLVKSELVPSGYNVDPVIYEFISQSKGHILEHPLYKTYVQNKDTFVYDVVGTLYVIEDLLNPTETEEKIIREARINATGKALVNTGDDSLLMMTEPKPSVRRRDLLSQEEQDDRIEAAKKKREKRELKRKKPG